MLSARPCRQWQQRLLYMSIICVQGAVHGLALSVVLCWQLLHWIPPCVTRMVHRRTTSVRRLATAALKFSLCDLMVHCPTTFVRGLAGAALEFSLCDLKGEQPNHLLSEDSSQVCQDYTTHVAPVAVHQQIRMVTRGTALQVLHATSCALCPYQSS